MPGTGTIFDDGYSGGSATFKPSYGGPGFTYTRFLTQSVLEKTFQAGFDAIWYIDTSVGKMQASLGYTFEYILDAGLVGGANQVNNYLSVGFTISH